MPGSIVKPVPGISRRSSCVSKSSMCTPLPCTSVPRLCPVRWMNCGAEAGPVEHRAAGAVDLEAAQLASRSRRVLHQGDRRVAPVARGVERLDVSVRDRLRL